MCYLGMLPVSYWCTEDCIDGITDELDDNAAELINPHQASAVSKAGVRLRGMRCFQLLRTCYWPTVKNTCKTAI